PRWAGVAAGGGAWAGWVSLGRRVARGAGGVTRERVLEVARRLDYQPDSRARLLRSGESRLLGVVFAVQHPFHDDMLTGLYDAADRLRDELAPSAVTPRPDERTPIAGLVQERGRGAARAAAADRRAGGASRPAAGGVDDARGAAQGRRRGTHRRPPGAAPGRRPPRGARPHPDSARRRRPDGGVGRPATGLSG